MTSRQQQLEQDTRDLARPGYAQQLFREIGAATRILGLPTDAPVPLFARRPAGTSSSRWWC